MQKKKRIGISTSMSYVNICVCVCKYIGECAKYEIVVDVFELMTSADIIIIRM